MIDAYYNEIEKKDVVYFYIDGHQCIGDVVGFKPNNIVVVEYRDLCYDIPAKEIQVL